MRALIRGPTSVGNSEAQYCPRRMLFVIDNYDSFTYNLVQYLGELGAQAVVRSGTTR